MLFGNGNFPVFVARNDLAAKRYFDLFCGSQGVNREDYSLQYVGSLGKEDLEILISGCPRAVELTMDSEVESE